MKVKSFTIKNFRSIKELTIDNLGPINVFFGKNNVGKSNIIRGLYWAFFCLNDAELFLPDAMFHNRNIYQPIDIKILLSLEKDYFNTEKIRETLRSSVENILKDKQSELSYANTDLLSEFVNATASFNPTIDIWLKISIRYNDPISAIDILMLDAKSQYEFNYSKYKELYKKLTDKTREIYISKTDLAVNNLLKVIPFRDPTTEKLRSIAKIADISELPLLEIRTIIQRLKETTIERLRTNEQKTQVISLFNDVENMLSGKANKFLINGFSACYNIIKEYFESISKVFVLIPNNEYFKKTPLDKREGITIDIFDINNFKYKLAKLIDSPSIKERKSIKQFMEIFNKSYASLGKLESVSKFREEVMAIFGNAFNSFPIGEQGAGVQDLFFYLAHIILFDDIILAIEEPERGLSTENQVILHEIIEEYYGSSDKQLFICSHSEQFESPNSYIIELGYRGTEEISKMKSKNEYEGKIPTILPRRNLEKEKAQSEVLLREMAERQVMLDVLNYINKLGDKEYLDYEKIAKALKYKKEDVKKALDDIIKKTNE